MSAACWAMWRCIPGQRQTLGARLGETDDVRSVLDNVALQFRGGQSLRLTFSRDHSPAQDRRQIGVDGQDDTVPWAPG